MDGDIMNNKGFTLIELIIVISVLAMIALLSAPSIVKLIEKNKVDNYNSTIDSILEATSLYASNNRYQLNFNDNCIPGDTKDVYTTITFNNLINSKDIKSPIKNFCTEENINNNTQIRIILNCGTKQFSYKIIGLKEKENITDEDGRIISGKTCSDLY